VWAFHLDHVGAEIAQREATQRSRDELRDLDDAKALEWAISRFRRHDDR
jgi:hypothetical protein